MLNIGVSLALITALHKLDCILVDAQSIVFLPYDFVCQSSVPKRLLQMPFIDFTQGIFCLEGSETVEKKHREGLLVELFLKHHILHGLEFNSSSFGPIFW